MISDMIKGQYGLFRSASNLRHLRQCRPYLESGAYYYIKPGKAFLIRADFLQVCAGMLFTPECAPSQRWIIPVRNGKGIKGRFAGQCVLFTANGECKIFDFRHAAVLSFISQDSGMRTGQYEFFSAYFHTPFVKRKGNLLLERCISHIPRKYWKEAEIKDNYDTVLNDLARFYRASKAVYWGNPYKERNIILKTGNRELQAMFDDLAKRCFDLGKMPYIYLHGDIHFGNTLFDGKRLWYIDYEYAREEVFFYDIFNPIFAELSDYGSTVLLDVLMSGGGTSAGTIASCFERFQLRFCPEKTEKYMYMYLMCRLLLASKLALKEKKRERIAKESRAIVEYHRTFYEYIKNISEKKVP